MRWPFVSRRRYEAVDADRERLRGERDQFAKDRDAYRKAAETAASQFTEADEKYTDACIVNECLTNDLAAARKQVAESTVTEWRARAAAEKRRADQLQKRLDDAVGLGGGRIEDSSPWQPGYKASKGVAS
ncbi:hypothetical protein [Streptomyces sp. NPDC088812]|uniref:hypothetical protein n=1 Tax=Streptomyces sp. NPDC088812 TaxID=3365905 RepID=UPI003812804D